MLDCRAAALQEVSSRVRERSLSENVTGASTITWELSKSIFDSLSRRPEAPNKSLTGNLFHGVYDEYVGISRIALLIVWDSTVHQLSATVRTDVRVGLFDAVSTIAAHVERYF
jgi:hypothetical protein